MHNNSLEEKVFILENQIIKESWYNVIGFLIEICTRVKINSFKNSLKNNTNQSNLIVDNKLYINHTATTTTHKLIQ